MSLHEFKESIKKSPIEEQERMMREYVMDKSKERNHHVNELVISKAGSPKFIRSQKSEEELYDLITRLKEYVNEGDTIKVMTKKLTWLGTQLSNNAELKVLENNENYIIHITSYLLDKDEFRKALNKEVKGMLKDDEKIEVIPYNNEIYSLNLKNNKITGLLTIGKSLVDLVVHKDYRNKGLATKLTSHALMMKSEYFISRITGPIKFFLKGGATIMINVNLKNTLPLKFDELKTDRFIIRGGGDGDINMPYGSIKSSDYGRQGRFKVKLTIDKGLSKESVNKAKKQIKDYIMKRYEVKTNFDN